MRERTLPTIKSKESALRMEVKSTQARGRLSRGEARKRNPELPVWAVALWNEFDLLLISVSDVRLSTKKIAGVVVPVLDGIDFDVKSFSLF